MSNSKAKRWISYVRHPFNFVFLYMAGHGKLNWMSDKSYLKKMYKIRMGKRLDLMHPVTLNEKLQWIKLYDRKPEYSLMVDKAEVKQVVSKLIGERYVIKSLGVWDSFEEIDFDSLPNQFVLKTTHDSGGVVVCRDKALFNKDAAREKLNKSLARNYFWRTREWPYKDIKPRILAEEYMEDAGNKNLPVFKIFCFEGNPTVIQVIQNDKTTEESIDYFNTEWELLDLRQNFPNSVNHMQKPHKLDEMLALASKLSKGHHFLRIDLYEINGSVFFSEFTFFTDAGFEPYHPEHWDYDFGEMIQIQ